MKKALIFGGKNFKELIRDPVSWGFGIVMPVAILILMQVIIKSIGSDAAAHVPMFALERFVGGIIVFGFSFLTMFCALLLSRDRTTAFLSRLFASPMRASDYIVGYSLPIIPMALAQIFLTYLLAICFGLTISVNILLAVVVALPIIPMFIGIGILIGGALGEKSAAPVCSVIVQMAALFSGMWFDLEMIGGGLNIFCHILPFAHAYDAMRFALIGEYSKILVPVLVSLAYSIVIVAAAILVFRKNMKKN